MNVFYMYFLRNTCTKKIIYTYVYIPYILYLISIPCMYVHILHSFIQVVPVGLLVRPKGKGVRPHCNSKFTMDNCSSHKLVGWAGLNGS